MSELTDILRDKGKTYELSGLAMNDRGDSLSACGFLAASLVFFELADALETAGEPDHLDTPQAA